MPAKHANDLKQTYALVAEAYQSRNQLFTDDQLEQMNIFLGLLPRGAEVLDIGAGTGRDSRYFVDQGLKMTLADISPEMLKLAKQLVPEATIIESDMLELSFPDNSFDGAWADASLLHLTKNEMKAMLNKIFGFLKPGGYFYVRLKAGQGEQEVEDIKYQQPVKRFFAFYTQEELAQLFLGLGFKVEQTFEDVTREHTWVSILAQKPKGA
jgi:ubiquinone/menaquinone biosynthesis C-methylase UbiE